MRLGVLNFFLLCSFASWTDSKLTIDYEHNRFLLHDKPYRYVSGSLHYFRVPRPLWHDRIRKMRAAGEQNFYQLPAKITRLERLSFRTQCGAILHSVELPSAAQ